MPEMFKVLDPLKGTPYGPGETVPAAETYRQLRKLSSLVARRHFARVYHTHRFPWDCPKCGCETAHSTRDDECLRCRRAGNRPSRAVAREEGRTLYRAECPTHGQTDFHVSVGKCAHCYNAVGTPRVLPKEASKRAMARRDGSRTYLGECPEHGEVEHYVHLGKCAYCFTSMGARRVRASTVVPFPPPAEPFDLANAFVRSGLTIDQLALASKLSPGVLVELLKLPTVPEPLASYLDALTRRLT